MPNTYLTTIEWEIDDVSSPREAAEEAWACVRASQGPIVHVEAPDGTATDVDLFETDEDEQPGTPAAA